MKALGIVLLVLVLLALLPLGIRVRYDEGGLCAFVKVWFIRLRVFPTKGKGKKKKKPPAAEKHSKGGTLDAVRAALPLVEPALVGVKKRLTIRDLELRVTWAADDPADAAVSYGYAQAALGTLWAVVEENFKVKKSRLGCGVDLDQPSPSVYADATLTMRLGQIVTLGVPLLVRFLRNNARIKRARMEKQQERGVKHE